MFTKISCVHVGSWTESFSLFSCKLSDCMFNTVDTQIQCIKIDLVAQKSKSLYSFSYFVSTLPFL